MWLKAGALTLGQTVVWQATHLAPSVLVAATAPPPSLQYHNFHTTQPGFNTETAFLPGSPSKHFPAHRPCLFPPPRLKDSLGWARVLEDVLLVAVHLTGHAHVLGLPVHTVVLDLVPLLGGPLDPGGDALNPLAIGGLQPALELGPEVKGGDKGEKRGL